MLSWWHYPTVIGFCLVKQNDGLQRWTVVPKFNLLWIWRLSNARQCVGFPATVERNDDLLSYTGFTKSLILQLFIIVAEMKCHVSCLTFSQQLWFTVLIIIIYYYSSNNIFSLTAHKTHQNPSCQINRFLWTQFSVRLNNIGLDFLSLHISHARHILGLWVVRDSWRKMC